MFMFNIISAQSKTTALHITFSIKKESAPFDKTGYYKKKWG
jgi:hypothetical protein